MDYTIFACATLILAISFPHWDPTGRMTTGAGQSRLLGLLGVLGHLGGTGAIGWSSGIGAGFVAFLAIPVAASVAYSLLVRPIARSARAKAKKSALPLNPRPIIREH
jgi:hypothetical protein